MSELPGMLQVAINVAEQRWPHTIDAAEWAKEWARIYAEKPQIAADEGTMIAWFANAIMAGYDTAEMRNADRIATLERAQSCIKGLLARTPVRDVSETLAEIDAAIASEKGERT